MSQFDMSVIPKQARDALIAQYTKADALGSIVQVALEALSGVPVDTIIKDVCAKVSTNQALTPVGGFITPPSTGGGAGGGGGKIVVTPAGATTTKTAATKTSAAIAGTPPKFIESKSAPVLDTAALDGYISGQQTFHAGAVLAVGIVSIIAEVFSLGQVDQTLQELHSILNLLPSGEVFSGTRAIWLENAVFRPYLYRLNSLNPNTLPTPSDLVRFRMREHEDGTSILTQPEFERIMGYLGFNSFWTDAFWTCRYQNPSNSELLELYRRGLIDKAGVKKWMLLNEQHPAFIDKYLEVFERLPTRQEARLMSRRRPLSDAQITEILKAEGVKASYFDSYKYMFINWDIDSINSRIQSEIVKMFSDGWLNDSEFGIQMSKTNASVDETAAMLQEATLKRTLRQVNERKATVLKLYTKRMLTKDEAVTILTAVGFEPVDIEHWLDFSEASRGDSPTIEETITTAEGAESLSANIIFSPLTRVATLKGK